MVLNMSNEATLFTPISKYSWIRATFSTKSNAVNSQRPDALCFLYLVHCPGIHSIINSRIITPIIGLNKMIWLNNIHLSIQGKSLFNELNLVFENDTNYLIDGKNGSGKTILLKLLAGNILPSAGAISYDFIDSSLDWQTKFELRKRYIHYIPVQAIHDLIDNHDMFYQQRYYTIEHTEAVTVRDFLGGRMVEFKRLQLPHSFQINQLLDLELSRLSNGQVKKVVILKRLLDSMPRVLLLDYPFEGLDARSRSELRDFLDHISQVYHIQLIIADHAHPELPTSLSKRILLSETIVSVSDFKQPRDSEWITPTFSPSLAIKNAEPIVEMQDVTIAYDHHVIVDRLSWRVNRGERWALTGRNGSGKTTLFSLIYADHPMAYSQKVFLFGKRRGTGESIWDIKKRISYLGPELLHFLDYPTRQFTVLSYLRMNKPSAEQLEQLITFFEIHEILEKQLHQLSHGQLQVILLCSLFLSQKELLLLDEPFQFLDPIQKKRVGEYLHSHLNTSITLILITHYEGDVALWTHQRLDLSRV